MNKLLLHFTVMEAYCRPTVWLFIRASKNLCWYPVFQTLLSWLLPYICPVSNHNASWLKHKWWKWFPVQGLAGNWWSRVIQPVFPGSLQSVGDNCGRLQFPHLEEEWVAISSEALTGMNDNRRSVSSHKTALCCVGLQSSVLCRCCIFSKPSSSRWVLAP